jgi:hypothetical protein
MSQVLEAVAKAILVTLVSTLAALAVEKIRRHNEDNNEGGYHQPYNDEYDHW